MTAGTAGTRRTSVGTVVVMTASVSGLLRPLLWIPAVVAVVLIALLGRAPEAAAVPSAAPAQLSEIAAAAAIAASDYDADDYQPMTPARLLDTRPGNATIDGQGPTGAAGPATTLTIPITGRAGLPTTGVDAVVVNLTATNPTIGGYATAWPTGAPRPLASNLNFTAGQTLPNLAIVKVGDSGAINLYNNTGTTDFIIDIAGWFPTTDNYQPMTPARLLDTRPGNATIDGQGPTGAAGPATTLTIPITGRAGLPTTGVDAVVVNLTATNPTIGGYATAWPTGAPRPLASNLNFTAGQ
ncbi:MAG: hypothetical protein KDC23_01045, partial [Actinobacteria bacterium]|nr:hypothetical protein [Actinomycetota bacterium]